MSNISVSPYGFLIFPKLNDYNNYLAFLKSSTPAKVQQYLDSLGFHSLGEKRNKQGYGLQRLSASQTASEDELADYILNSDGVVQVENAIMKPIDETTAEVIWQFLLVMTPEYLSSTSYADLAAGIYDPNTMDQFATNPDDVNLNFFDFIENTPTGYAEMDANSAVARRPMFGHSDWINNGCDLEPDPNNWVDFNGDGIADPTYIQKRHRRTYIFWIGVGWDDDKYPAYSCL